MASRSPALVADTLAVAMIASSVTPLLLLDDNLAVVTASHSFGAAFGIDPVRAIGQSIFKVGRGEWDLPTLRSLLAATVAGGVEVDAYELDFASSRSGKRRLVVNAHRLEYDDADRPRLLLAVTDVTDKRAHDRQIDDLVREKAVLVQEVQHRIANSLQIIAGVLMQSARRTQIEEACTHLTDAHHRVMSVAAVQRQLTISSQGSVALRPYLTQLCKNIGASMIADHAQLRIDVAVDDSEVGGDISVSVGLIVTELVINALKHAFPGHRRGRILVEYRSQASSWTLTVSDDGVGMPTGPVAANVGLGTTIVEALARQLKADARVSDARPGTSVSIVHSTLQVSANLERTPELEAL